MLWVLFAASMWGTWSLYLRPTGLSGLVISPLFFAFLSLSALPFFVLEKRAKWSTRTVCVLIALGVMGALNVVTFFAAMQSGSIQVAVLTHSFAPVLVALATPWVEKRRVQNAVPLALLALSGLALVLEPWRSHGAHVLWPAILGSISALAYAINIFLMAHLGDELGAARTMSLHALIASLLLWPLVLLLPSTHAQLPLLFTATNVFRVALASLIPGALAGIAFMRGVQKIGSTKAAILAYLEPVVACAIGIVVFAEDVSAFTILGGSMVLCAGALTATMKSS